MSNFFEIDFLDVESNKSGDAITVRYSINGEISIHVVDGGFQATGESVVKHIKDFYNSPSYIDRVVVTHPDGDHAGGLRTVLESFTIGQLWMLRPWLYADEIIDKFENYTSADRLRSRLKTLYPNLAALEEIALERGIEILEPFQGSVLGEFTVLAPSRERYLDLIVESDRTPESVEEAQRSAFSSMGEAFGTAMAKVTNLFRAVWGEEVFSTNETSAENEMSVVQYATLCDLKILLTADAGRSALTEAADYAPKVGLTLPGIDRFQVPHHGSRRNVNSEILDRWLGERKDDENQNLGTFTTVISSAKADTHHPRKAVVRALIHRGASVFTTEGNAVRSSKNAPDRAGWGPAVPESYPTEQEQNSLAQGAS